MTYDSEYHLLMSFKGKTAWSVPVNAIDVIVRSIIPIVETMLLRVGLKKPSEAYGEVIGLPIGTTKIPEFGSQLRW